MSYKDKFNLEITTENSETVEAFNEFIFQILRYGNNPQIIFEIAEKDSKCCLVNSLSSILHSLAETNLNLDLAANYFNQAKNSSYAVENRITQREKLYLSIAESLLQQDQKQAFKLFEDLVQKYPTDLLASKILQTQYFNCGDKRNLCKIANYSLQHNPTNHFVQGMAAFGLVEMENYEVAERLGREAVRLAPGGNDPWAQHAVAHCLDMKGRIEEGIQWLEPFSSTWDDCGAFMNTHNWWHTSLFYMDLDNFPKVFDIYDNHVWNQFKDDVQCQAGAVSLLWRCDIRKVPVLSRWEDLTDYVKPHIHDHLRPFLDIHYLYALARNGEDEKIEEMFQEIENNSKFTQTQIEITETCGKAVVHYAKGQFQQTCEEIEKISNRLNEIGASNAQADVFNLTYTDSLVQTQKYQQALDLLIPRSTQRPKTQYLKREINRVQELVK